MTNGDRPEPPLELHDTPARPPTRPVRKDETILSERGLYVEVWLPERRSRRRPLLLLHGELAGSWLWERYLGYFAGRGWEGHALNLRSHFWSETADLATLTIESYVDDAQAAFDRLAVRGPVVIGHGMGALLALKLAERNPVGGLVLLAPPLPDPLHPLPNPRDLQIPARFRQDALGWRGAVEELRSLNPDLTSADVLRIQHFLAAESGTARKQLLRGVPVNRSAAAHSPILVMGGGLDRIYPALDAERLAEWLGSEYRGFGAHSHFGLVLGERSFEQVADGIRQWLEHHRL